MAKRQAQETDGGAAAAPTAARSEAARFLLSEHRFRWAELVPWAVAVAVFFLFPGYRLLATQILVMILFALSLDLIVGYAGIVSLGHAAFFGTGAYTAALLASNAERVVELGYPFLAGVMTDPLFGLVVGALLAAVLGFLSGWVVLRTHGLTLLMLTMAVTIVLYELANDFDEITGGFDGINFANTKILGLVELDQLYYTTSYLYALFFLLLGFLIIRAIVYSPFGRSLVGMRENVRRMHAVGTPVHWRLVRVYTVAAAIAGVAGAIWVQVQGNVTTEVYSFELSGEVLIMLILGGTGRMFGAFVGAFVYKVLESLTEPILGTDLPYWQLAIGVALILTVMFARRGLFGIFLDASRYWQVRLYLVGGLGFALIVLERLVGAAVDDALGEGSVTYGLIAWLVLAAAFIAASWQGLSAAAVSWWRGARQLGRTTAARLRSRTARAKEGAT